MASRQRNTQCISNQTSAAVNTLAQAICAMPGAAGQSACLVDEVKKFTRMFGISPQTRSVLTQLVIAVLSLKRDRIVAELEEMERTTADSEQIPKNAIDREVEHILRLSYKEGGAA